jgi:hypothetical protein
MTMMTTLRVAAVLACAGLSACAGRTPAPVAVVQEHDQLADCQAITAEIQSNTAQIGKLGSEEGAKVAQNVIVGAAGLFIPVLWFGMDFQDAAGKEGKALQQRNSYLSRLAATRCAPPAQGGLLPSRG